MSGYAVSIDLSYYRAVQGPLQEDGDPEGSTYPDYSVETYLPFDQGPPPQPIPVPPTAEEARKSALFERDRLLVTAAIRIAPLQDAVDLGDATPADEANLKKWKQYRVALNRIDQQAGFPEIIEWPLSPA